LALNEEILSASDDEFSLDDVARELWQSESEVDADTVADIVAGMTGNKPDALHISRLPGCRTMTAASRAF
jgi:predicted metalloprotease with PDZ domain